MNSHWETQVASLLTELLSAQEELLSLLQEKRRCLAASDTAGLAAMQGRENAVIGRLQACHASREELLKQAAADGRPGESIRALAQSLPAASRAELKPQIDEAMHRSRLLRHHSLASWVVIQRSLLHLAGLLEIIATGGRGRPTYVLGDSTLPGGALVDQAV